MFYGTLGKIQHVGKDKKESFSNICGVCRLTEYLKRLIISAYARSQYMRNVDNEKLVKMDGTGHENRVYRLHRKVADEIGKEASEYGHRGAENSYMRNPE